jgi:dihydroorotate dehydrogenase (fumarate)
MKLESSKDFNAAANADLQSFSAALHSSQQPIAAAEKGPSLAVETLGHFFTNPFMNAAGVLCTTESDISEMCSSASGTLITKSCTLEFRQGNPEPRFSSAPFGTINSMGLPNLGFEFYKKVAETHSGKPLFVSVSGMSMDDNVEMARQLSPIAVQRAVLMELNLSCPNVPGKAQVGYDFETMRKYLSRISEVYEAPFGIKLPPYFDIAHFDHAAEIFNSFPQVQFLTCVNSLGNGLMVDVESECVLIKPKQGFGGIGGRYILPTALANVNAFARRCPTKVIIGCGGVYGGEEAFMHILAGAHLVQVGSALHEEGSSIFQRVQDELLAIMKKKGYTNMEQFRGKIKVID